jgi:hypothetical protein
MMEAADHGHLDDLAFVKALHPSWLRGVLRQGEVGAGPMLVDEVLAQYAAQMGFVQHHDVVEALAAEGADEPFHVGILPSDRGAARPHQSLANNSPHPRVVQPPSGGRIIAMPQVDGLHHCYQRAA